MTATVFTMDSIAEFCAMRDTGERVEVDRELWYYFLEVLPPIHMTYDATLTDGKVIKASFGSAEGADRVTAFWQGWFGEEKGRYFAQHTREIARGY